MTMRDLLLGGGLLLLSCCAAPTASAKEARPLLLLYHDGYALRGDHFRVTFVFPDMPAPPASKEENSALKPPGILSPANEWSVGADVTARLEYCCVRRDVGGGEMTLVGVRLRLTNASAQPF